MAVRIGTKSEDGVWQLAAWFGNRCLHVVWYRGRRYVGFRWRKNPCAQIGPLIVRTFKVAEVAQP